MMTNFSNMSYDALMNVASILILNQGCGAASHIGAFRKQHVHPYSTCTYGDFVPQAAEMTPKIPKHQREKYGLVTMVSSVA